MPLDWKPRGRDVIIGNIPWLARITDKARAKLRGVIGEYIYPCPADKAFLEKYGLTEEEFTRMVKENPTDNEMIAAMRKVIESRKP
ncbi:MAG: hypothetical protein KatS3mg115_0641 [Candidatus Poribacteria bacterium]|nr:MAG: hypothetical protein KatS3mg115_0641 [Candidatus Poribacteria bacterium]